MAVQTMIRAQTPEDDPSVVQLFHELSPEFPHVSLEEYRARVANLAADVHHARWVAERDGEVLGHAMLLQKFWVSDPGSFASSVEVFPQHWNQGIGTALYDELLEAAHQAQASKLSREVREDHPAALNFARKRGFRETGAVERNARLDINEVNFQGYEGLEERLAAEGIHVLSFAQLNPSDALLRQIYEVDLITARDIPHSEGFDPPFERWHRFVVEFPGKSPQSTFVAMAADEPIGLTSLMREGGNCAWSQGLSVIREYRGRGIARLLKKQAIEWAKASGIDYMYTGNDLDNPRVIAINNRLGYKPLPNLIELAATLDAAHPH